MKIRIEDNFEDVIGKATGGLGLTSEDLAKKTDVARDDIQALLAGRYNENNLRELAPALELDPDALVAMATNQWYPDTILVPGLECYNTAFPISGYEEMTVNSYLVWSEATREAIAFDTGTSIDMLLADLNKNELTLKAVFLTHTHRDHVLACDRLLEATGRPTLYAPEKEPYNGAEAVPDKARVTIGPFIIEARLTYGHSPGGTSYLVDGLPEPIAFVGDSLFCMSMGGAKNAYAEALENNRKRILSLAGETILCPGHGPITSVDEEREHNPFFPELIKSKEEL
ncbi:MAG: MBL fold metallo-hydrolase [Opitutales bacterium]